MIASIAPLTFRVPSSRAACRRMEGSASFRAAWIEPDPPSASSAQIACHTAGALPCASTASSSFNAFRSASRRWATRRTWREGWDRPRTSSSFVASNGAAIAAGRYQAGFGAARLAPPV
jgi:hypothetical protein